MTRSLMSPTLEVLGRIVNASERGICGIEIMEETGLRSSSVYSILSRLESDGFVFSYEEDPGMREVNRPIRIYYKMTEGGVMEVRKMISYLGGNKRLSVING